MRICRFRKEGGPVCLGLELPGDRIGELSAAGIESLESLWEHEDYLTHLERLTTSSLASYPMDRVNLLAPVERQEIWAAGVTYLRSKKARMDESDFSATAYDLVYDAARPELFFKSLPEKVVGPGDTVGIRRDAGWNVPEPELALVLNSRGKIVGYTIGNDMSSRDIEGENLLYLPQAKIYNRSCALGPWINVGTPESEVRRWEISIEIRRDSKAVFSGATSIGNIRRSFLDLAEFLFRSQTFPHGAVLLTGTGVVPADDFSLQEKDNIKISIAAIGTLENVVTLV